MRWIAALFAFLLIAAALVYHLMIRDRSFESYSGIRVGMPVRTALTRLESQGYLVISGADEKRAGDCDPKGHVLIYARAPDYDLHIAPSPGCKVGKITRRLSNFEL